MVRVVMMEQVRLGEWNEKGMKENGQLEYCSFHNSNKLSCKPINIKHH